MAKQKKQKNTKLIGRFAPYFKPYLGVLVLDLFCASLTTVCELVLPLIIRRITDLAINDISKLTVSAVLSMGGIYLALRLVDGAANYYMANIGHMMGAKIETDMRRDLFSHLQRLSYTYYDNTKVGQIMARITSDLFDVTEFAHHCPEEFFIAALKIVVAFAILITMNVPLTLLVFATIPFLIVGAKYFQKRMRAAFKESRNQIGELNAQVEDSLLGVRVVKSFANEEMEKEKFEKGNQKFLMIKRVMYRYMAGFQTTTRIFDGLMYIVVVVAGGLFIIGRAISPSDYMAYLLYVTTLLTSIRRIVEFTEQFQRGMTGIERFIEVMDARVDIEDAPGAAELPPVRGEIALENVTFQYEEEGEEILSNLNVHIPVGHNVALVGPSGAGKTTLCNLIPRFYDVTGGRVTIDGVDVRTVTLASLRRQIGVVQQEVYLFSGTVYENIAYGKPHATREEIIEAAKLAGAHEFIEELADGYETNVGERGVKLSGGQKQRISIARVFLKNPPILILDEATSALDNESEVIVQKSLEKLAEGRTTFTIAHRLTTIRNATTILVLTKDGIQEQGSHKKLMEHKGLYYQLYRMYQERS